jgi:hypothetical protein
VPLQDWIHHWEEGAGAKVLKVAAAILGFVALAGLFDALAYQSFSSEEAMETAQLARNLSRGKGYTTQTIRPLSIYLLRKQAPPGQAAGVLRQPVPDLARRRLSGFVGGVDGGIAVRFRRHPILGLRAGTMDRRLQSGFVLRGGASVVSHCPAVV